SARGATLTIMRTPPLNAEQPRAELERPLGLDLPRPRRGIAPAALARRLTIAFVALGLLGASAAVSLRESPFRAPSQAVVAVAIEPEPPQARSASRPPQQQPM